MSNLSLNIVATVVCVYNLRLIIRVHFFANNIVLHSLNCSELAGIRPFYSHPWLSGRNDSNKRQLWAITRTVLLNVFCSLVATC